MSKPEDFVNYYGNEQTDQLSPKKYLLQNNIDYIERDDGKI